MSFCPNCGAQIPEGSTTCPNCHASLQPGAPQATTPPPVPPPSPAAMAKTSGMAIASMILGILGVISFGYFFLLGLIGIILGIVALRKISGSPEQLKGKGMAIAGIATGGVSIFFALLLVAIAIPSFIKFSGKAKQSEAKTNLGAIFTAMQSYYLEWNTYPARGNIEGQNYGCFELIGFQPEGTSRYSYFCGDHVIQATDGGPYEIPPGVDPPYSNEFSFRVLAVGNIDSDDTLDVWELNENKVIRNIIDDVEQ
jgi:type II secretory pathway pseudopilin PulG